MEKTISFAIPCYNSAEYMDKCIEKLLELNNDKDDVEIIIVDDGSQKDNTLEIAQAWEKKHPNVIKAIHQENGGHGQAVNTGLKNATGLYYKVVDSDDHLDTEGMRPVMKYIRKQAELVSNSKNSEKKHTATDLVIANYVYDKVEEGIQNPIDYKDALPVEKVFGWDEIGHFKPSENLLMHSVFYRTQLLKDIKLELPKHTFYVDNIFVYVPLPHVKTIYYIDTNAYMYFIGRDDQSVNQKVMMGRIDQQLRVTKIMIDETNYPELKKNPKLCRYMISYLSIMMTICSIFLRMKDDEESEKKREEIWEYLENADEDLYNKVRRNITCVGTNLPGHLGKAIGVAGYHLAQRVVGFN